MKATELIEGLQIITKYEPGAEISAQHDQIYAGSYQPKKLTKAEREEMEHAGWFGEEESWTHFT